MINQNPTCPLCAKPITSGILVVFEHGELLHVGCQRRAIERADLDAADRAEVARTRAENAAGDSVVPQHAQLTRRDLRHCPVCATPAVVTDWRPSHLDWLVVEGCACGDFFVSAAVFDARLGRLSAKDRHALSTRIRWFRAQGAEAWCTTTDGTGDGTLDIRERRTS